MNKNSERPRQDEKRSPAGQSRGRRHTLQELLIDAELAKELNDQTALASEGAPVGRELK